MIDDASHPDHAGAQPCGCSRYDHTDNLAISPCQLYLVRAPRLGLETERSPWPDATPKPNRLELAGAVQVAGLSLGGKGQVEPCLSLSLSSSASSPFLLHSLTASSKKPNPRRLRLQREFYMQQWRPCPKPKASEPRMHISTPASPMALKAPRSTAPCLSSSPPLTSPLPSTEV